VLTDSATSLGRFLTSLGYGWHRAGFRDYRMAINKAVILLEREQKKYSGDCGPYGSRLHFCLRFMELEGFLFAVKL